MRLFFGSDIIGNQKIFAVTVTATNATYTGDSSIAIGGTASLLFEADSGYELPSSVTVTGATSVWDDSTGVLILSNASGAVTVSVEATLIPVVVDQIYGVSGLYDSSPALTRTDDAVGMSATVNSSTGLVSSDFDSVFPYNEMVKTTIGTNEFVYIPSMWFRIGKDSAGRLTDIAVSETRGDSGNWFQTKAFYYGAYGASLYNDGGTNKLQSVSGVSRRSDDKRGDYRTWAQNVGLGQGEYSYYQLDLYGRTVVFFLWLIEFATKNSQLVMLGSDTKESTGGTDNLTTPSGYNTATGQMRYHYIEDFVGSVCEWLDGFVGNYSAGGIRYVTDDPSKFNDTGSGFNTYAYNAPNTAGNCIKSLAWDDTNPFLVLPLEVEDIGIYNQYFCDYTGKDNESGIYVGSRTGYVSSADYGVSSMRTYAALGALGFVGTRLMCIEN